MNQNLARDLAFINILDWLISRVISGKKEDTLDLAERGLDGVVTYQVAKRVAPGYTDQIGTLTIVHFSVKMILALPIAILESASGQKID